jgi:hypothetical protein
MISRALATAERSYVQAKTPAMPNLHLSKGVATRSEAAGGPSARSTYDVKSFCVRHHGNDACCRGLLNLHCDDFAAGQIAQRPRLVEFVR